MGGGGVVGDAEVVSSPGCLVAVLLGCSPFDVAVFGDHNVKDYVTLDSGGSRFRRVNGRNFSNQVVGLDHAANFDSTHDGLGVRWRGRWRRYGAEETRGDDGSARNPFFPL